MKCLSQIEGLVSAVEAAENCPFGAYAYCLVDAEKMQVFCLTLPEGADDDNLGKDFQPHILPVFLFYEPGRNNLQNTINGIVFCCYCGAYKGFSKLCGERKPYAEKVFNEWKQYSTLLDFREEAQTMQD